MSASAPPYVGRLHGVLAVLPSTRIARSLERVGTLLGCGRVRRLRRYGPVERGAGIAAERKRGPERFLFGDLTSEAIEGGGRSLLRLISGRIPNLKLGPLHRLDSRPACGDATVQPANSVSPPALRVSPRSDHKRGPSFALRRPWQSSAPGATPVVGLMQSFPKSRLFGVPSRVLPAHSCNPPR